MTQLPRDREAARDAATAPAGTAAHPGPPRCAPAASDAPGTHPQPICRPALQGHALQRHRPLPGIATSTQPTAAAAPAAAATAAAATAAAATASSHATPS